MAFVVHRHDHPPVQRNDYKRCVMFQRDWGSPVNGGDGSAVSKDRPRYAYEPLLSSDSIRLLELEPGSEGDALRATVQVVCLKAQPKYAALSCAWSDRDEVAPLMINDTFMLIKRNLAHALCAIRDRERQHYFWIDAICINQADVFEKTSQIKRMPEIYSRAESTLVWLQGDSSDVRWICWNCLRSSSKSSADFRAHLCDQHNSPSPIAMMERFDMVRAPKLPETLQSSLHLEWKENLEGFAEHQSRLCKLFSTCEDDEFPYLAITLSTILTSFQALRPTEIARVAALSMSTNMSFQNMDDLTKFLAIRGLYQDAKAQYLEAMLKSKWSEVLHMDPQGYVRLTNESMGFFFSKVPIRGIDTKHEIMANACLRELEFGALLVGMDQSLDINGCNSVYVVSDLTPYATQFWHLHYGLAQDLNPALSERLHKLLWGQLQAVSRPGAADQASPKVPCSFQQHSCAEMALAYCKERDFRVLGNAYAQMKAISRANTARCGASRRCRGRSDQGQILGTAFSRCHIRSDIERGSDCGRKSSGELPCPAIPWKTDCDGDSADSTVGEADWLMVDYSEYET